MLMLVPPSAIHFIILSGLYISVVIIHPDSSNSYRIAKLYLPLNANLPGHFPLGFVVSSTIIVINVFIWRHCESCALGLFNLIFTILSFWYMQMGEIFKFFFTRFTYALVCFGVAGLALFPFSRHIAPNFSSRVCIHKYLWQYYYSFILWSFPL